MLTQVCAEFKEKKIATACKSLTSSETNVAEASLQTVQEADVNGRNNLNLNCLCSSTVNKK